MKRVVIVFWLTIGFGFLAPAAVTIGVDVSKGAAIGSAFSRYLQHLFEPGFNEFLLALIEAAPFAAAAIFLLFHLTGEHTTRGRWSGVALGLCAGAALDLFAQVQIRISRSSTAGIGYIFLPVEVLLIMAIGYGAGRAIASAMRLR